MDQRTHAWIAIRAIALLDDEGKTQNLVNLLKPSVKAADIGAWLPDLIDAKISGEDTDNHNFKLKPYKGRQKYRFTMPKPTLLKKIGPARKLHTFLKDDKTLSDKWWKTPYKANTHPGEHIPNRASALHTSIIDLAIMGDSATIYYIPGRQRLSSRLPKTARSPIHQIAMYFFMQSHFIADAIMPCHCDARHISGYSRGLHRELEKHWAKKIGTYFDKKKLKKNTSRSSTILKEARKIDKEFDITFKNEVPKLKTKDIWKEMVFICRGSFAVSSILVPPSKIPYRSKKTTTFEDLFEKTPEGPPLLKKLDQMTMHDAVLNTAIAWKAIWKKLQPER